MSISAVLVRLLVVGRNWSRPQAGKAKEDLMARFMVRARDAYSWDTMSPEEIEQCMGRYKAWDEEIRGATKFITGEKLGDDPGRVMRRDDRGGLVVTDRPYAESKEVLGGFVVLEAADYDEAVRLVSDHPHLEFGSLEVRQLD
jgi:hypothetical protein